MYICHCKFKTYIEPKFIRHVCNPYKTEFKCKTCEFKADCWEDVSKHEDTHTPPIVCNCCNMNLYSTDELLKHKETERHRISRNNYINSIKKEIRDKHKIEPDDDLPRELYRELVQRITSKAFTFN